MAIKPKSYALHPHTVAEHGMVFGHYYVVEISFRPSNPVHRYIAYNPRHTSVELAGAGLDIEDRFVRLDQLAFFRVVEEIASMSERASTFLPPSFDAGTPAVPSAK